MSSIQPQSSKRQNRARGRTAWRLLTYLKTPLIAATTVTLLNPLLLQPFFGHVSKTTLVLVLLLEGGVGLVASTAIVLSSTPSISKAGEITFGTARWSREGERNAERVAGKWIVGSTVLILIGFALSSF
ncbi:MAG TPA: hypothetical protein VNA15_02940 [Candidatus Angelobacter sp.]|nr:hypothetical protein [Candidatus Angelobacter sp.]